MCCIKKFCALNCDVALILICHYVFGISDGDSNDNDQVKSDISMVYETAHNHNLGVAFKVRRAFVTIHHKRALKSASTSFWFAGLYNHPIAVTYDKTEVL